MVVMLLALFTKPDYFKKNAQSSSSSSSSYLIEGSSTAVVAKGKRSREDVSHRDDYNILYHSEKTILLNFLLSLPKNELLLSLLKKSRRSVF
jgi:hypothetical protein